MTVVDRDDLTRLLVRMAAAVRKGHGIALEPSTLAYLLAFIEAVSVEIERLQGKETS